MNLRELQTAVENAIKSAYHDGQNPESIIVSLQIDDKAAPDHGYVISTEDIDLTYDNDCMACGCVLNGWRDTSSGEKKPPEVCPQCKRLTGIKVPRNDSVYCEDCGWPDDDFGKEEPEETEIFVMMDGDSECICAFDSEIKAKDEAETCQCRFEKIPLYSQAKATEKGDSE